MKRRFEDALQNCLEALATGRATVDECLARYPDLAADLEPPLRMGERLQEVYDVEPSPLYAQAARQRFLVALASRRQRALAAHPRRAPWRWAPAALGSAALVTFALWAGVLALGSGSTWTSPDGGEVVFSVPPPTAEAPAPQPMVREQVGPQAERHLAAIRSAVEQGAPVEPTDLQGLRQVNETLAATLDDPEVSDEDVSYIEELLDEQENLFSGLGELVSPEANEDLQETITIAATVRIRLQELRSPTPTATPEASPAPEDTPTATPEATETPAPTPTSEAMSGGTPQTSPTPEAEDEATEETNPVPTAAP